MIYSKASKHETNISLKQFNVQGPIHSIDKANQVKEIQNKIAHYTEICN